MGGNRRQDDNIQFKINLKKLVLQVSAGLSPSRIANNGRIFIPGNGSSSSKIVQFFMQTQSNN
jgi:hypothetical protein